MQAELERALAQFHRRPVDVTVAGRTDAGVHARGQVASHAGEPAPLHALNAALPSDIRVLLSSAAPDGFDARRDALSRTYRYRVFNRAVMSPFELGFALHERRALEGGGIGRVPGSHDGIGGELGSAGGIGGELGSAGGIGGELGSAGGIGGVPASGAVPGSLRDCAAALLGTHDFTAFTPRDTSHVRFSRTIIRAEWVRESEHVLAFWIEADTFMRHMVRVLVGSMLAVARGRFDVAWFEALLAGAPRSEAAETAPPHGLYLERVRYENDEQ